MRPARLTGATSATQDLEAIGAWYSDQALPDVGNRLLLALVGRIESLRAFPERGRIVPELGMESIRELIHPPFRIVYRLDRGTVRVLRVWRSERPLRLPAE